MDNNLYARQEALDLYVPDSVCIVGVGGTGTWIAIGLAMSGVPELYLIDPDFLEDHNRNRLPFTASQVSRSKVDAAGDLIVSLRPDINLIKMHTKASGDTLGIIPSGIVVDCTDRYSTQLELEEACKQYGKTYIRDGYDGTKISVTSTIPRWDLGGAQDSGYEIVPSWVATPMVAAGFTLAKIMKNPKLEVSIDITKGISNVERSNKIPKEQTFYDEVCRNQRSKRNTPALTSEEDIKRMQGILREGE